MAANGKPPVGVGENIKQIGRTDLPGGGSVVVENGYAYVGHIDPPDGTSIIDVRDPKNPKVVAQLEVPEGIHSHKVRVSGDVMLINYERYKTKKEPQAGLKVFDISDRAKPREIAFFKAAEKGVHRFTFDGRYAYLSPHMEGYIGNIALILDLKNPDKPEEVGRWWMPGQWKAGGETPTWHGWDHRCHHPIRRGDRLYISYWHGGFVILDIEDMGKPRYVSGLDWSPPFPWPTHTTLPVPFPLMGRQIMLVADEDVLRLTKDATSSFLWLVDITDETRPTPFASFQVDGIDGSPQPEFTGCHPPAEEVRGTEIPVAWFAHGLRIVDISKPHAPREVASFVPPVPEGASRVCSNDVCYDSRGLMYLIDRQRGLHIVERV